MATADDALSPPIKQRRPYTPWRRETAVCQGCGAEVEFSPSRKWCEACKADRQREAEKDRYQPAPTAVSATCRVCSVAFTYERKGRGRHRRYCGDECRAKGMGRLVEPVACKTCGKSFLPRPKCGGYCSSECWPRDHRRIWASKADEKRACRHRRKARLANTAVETFADSEIFERDGWRCGICGKAVDKALTYPHPMSVSLDHIEPIARGGGHTRANVQCSHFICNSRKTHLGRGGQFKLPF